jgi:cytochrome c-type biogenesis protein
MLKYWITWKRDVIIGVMIENKTPSLNQPDHFRVMFHALLFVLGFSLVFVVGWGGAATVLGRVFTAYKEIIGRIGGVFITILGLFTLGVINIPWLNYEKRGYWQIGRGGRAVSSFMMGILFAAGWTPCIGTTLGAILTLGLSRESSAEAMILSAGYALGMAIPFLALGFGAQKAVEFFGRFRKHIRTIAMLCGILIILMGLLMIFNQMSLITRWALSNGFFIDVPSGKMDVPTFAVSILAGMLSFLSPCVLPLVPAYLGYLGGSGLSNSH